jgi:hypothetical protein
MAAAPACPFWPIKDEPSMSGQAGVARYEFAIWRSACIRGHGTHMPNWGLTATDKWSGCD